jgi:hypothetical protein
VNPLLAAAAQVQDLCAASGWRFCFIGGLAVLRWGEPRLTRDVDLTIVTGFGGETPVVLAALERFASRVEDPVAFAGANRVLLLRASNGIPIDVALGGLPFEERAAQRSSLFLYGEGALLRTCSAEDLVVMKVFAGRDGDWADIAGLVARCGGELDTASVWEELTPLLEAIGAPERAVRLRALLHAASG